MLKTRKMKKNSLILLVFIALLGVFTSCEEDGERLVFPEDVIPPALQELPDLTLERVTATDTLIFLGSAVDPGFTASANYFLEACESGTDFADAIQIITATSPDTMKITVSQLNGLLLEQFPGDATSTLDFRLRSILVVDAGPMPEGMTREPMEYISEVTTTDVTLYGLPRLELIDSGLEQKLVSPNGDGVYNGVVKLDPDSPFTLFDPDFEISYGGAGGTLVTDGTGIVSTQDGWSMLTVNLNDLSYTIEQFSMGLIGSAVPPYDWSVDVDMEYDPENSMWYITLDLEEGVLKFRRNDGWSWNMGFVDGTENPGLSGPTQQGGVGNDIPVPEAGNYTVSLTVFNNNSGFYELTKNN